MMRSSFRGYTLIEIMIVMGLIMIVFTVAVVSLNTVDAEKRMREAIQPFEHLSRSARALAKQDQQVYLLTVTQEKLELRSVHFEKESQRRERLGEEELRELPALINLSEPLSQEDGLSYEVLRWGETTWEPLKKKSKHVLRFEPTGLCEPVGFKVIAGENWIQQQIHPLTAQFDPEEERFAIKAE